MLSGIPNQLTALRIVLTPVFGVMAISPDVNVRFWSIVIFAIASLTDFYDGYFARRYKRVSEVGSFLDPLADKLLIGTGLFVIVSYGILDIWLVSIVVGRDLLVTGLRIYASKKNIPVVTSKTAKFKTFLQLVFLYSLLLVLLFKTSGFFSMTTTNKILYSDGVEYIMMFLAALSLYTAAEYVVQNFLAKRVSQKTQKT